MRLMTERKAEDFLSKKGFDIIESSFASSKFGVKRALKKIGLPCVMKVSGNKIVHKGVLGGVKTNIKTYSEALHEFSNFKRIRGSNGVVFQKKASGKEFILGLKKNKDFSHVLVFGKGGSDVERKKDVSFRVCPLKEKDIYNMIKETKIGKKLSKTFKEIIKENIFKLCDLSIEYPNIAELDINPLIISKKEGKVVDARIVFD